MTNFLIESTICLAVFLFFYNLFLEREKIHQFNRVYLLLSIVISIVIPFLNFQIFKIVPVFQKLEPLKTVITSSIITENEIHQNSLLIEEKINFFPYLLWSLYGIISCFLLLRFGKNVWKLIVKSKSKTILKFKNANLILVEEKTLPYTFLNSIFINIEDFNNRSIEEELYAHELVHVAQKHTLDILFIEFLKVIFWFNPIFIFYKKAIQLNHEFLADEEILKTYNNVSFYQNLLLKKSNNFKNIYLASNLNYSVTKKRLIMMTKHTSQKIAFFKKIAIVPVFFGLIYFFCIDVIAKEKIININYVEKDFDLINTNSFNHKSKDSIKIVIDKTRNDESIDKFKKETISSINDKIENYVIPLNEKKDKKVIVIDAGHGGHDFGAIKDEWKEKTLTSEIAKRIKEIHSDSAVEIHFTRSNDEFITLNDRTNLINNLKPDLVISLHINSSKNIFTNGFEVFISNKIDFFDKTKELAELLSSKLTNTQLRNRGLKIAPFWILKNSDCPSMVVELGFLSNENDRNYISSEKGQIEIAKYIVAFISDVK
ncbi:MAG: N-acetylmuramoyl-L-alanine amidase [Flavobacteriales bacterium]|nr:N-acetylmuramoyl-L-alanine amidase [Flavobacteriales bacterium]